MLGDSESGLDDEATEIPLPNGLLSNVEELAASLQGVIDAVDYAGPRDESSAR